MKAPVILEATAGRWWRVTRLDTPADRAPVLHDYRQSAPRGVPVRVTELRGRGTP